MVLRDVLKSAAILQLLAAIALLLLNWELAETEGRAQAWIHPYASPLVVWLSLFIWWKAWSRTVYRVLADADQSRRRRSTLFRIVRPVALVTVRTLSATLRWLWGTFIIIAFGGRHSETERDIREHDRFTALDGPDVWSGDNADVPASSWVPYEEDKKS